MTSASTNGHAARVPRQPWPLFFAKGLAAVALLYTAGHFAAQRWQLGIDPQAQVSVHTADGASPRLVIVDRYDRDMARGDIAAFEMNSVAKQMVASTGLGIPADILNKRVAGLPGDHIVVNEQGVFVNGIKRADGLALAGTFGRTPAAFTRRLTVPEGHFFMLGDAVASFDSRYWGLLDEAELIGTTHVLYAE